MAAQDPATGGFTYMTPLMTGSRRGYSTPHEDGFWCCIGTGMESHSKHGESIFWEGDGTLLVNLYIPAEATWAARGAKLALETKYPMQPESRLKLTSLRKPAKFAIALRIPSWAKGKATVTVNGKPFTPGSRNGYAVVDRGWREGDVVAITLPLDLRIESAPGDANTIAVLRGPMVMAADLAPASQNWDNPDPAMVGQDLLGGFKPTGKLERVSYETKGVVRPADLTFVPFYSQYERRSAVYFKRFSEDQWNFEFTMQTRPGPLVLLATYWGDERGQNFDILVDDVLLASQQLKNDKPGKFFDVEYAVPEALTKGKATIRVRFVPHNRSTAGPVFGVRLFTQKPAAESAS
jgi:hypothetical protein